ncbi:hypothetical protein [Novacetimonas pomaceti]|uniref:Lipoprotein n=1 Tax=Novacetimonas pomaceti TaxID=2021998 RepID=A0ABX5P607_9PROT|nr:hypothetical protein [Novacetimonas pomaceti]MBV1835175.1 hypothetical protein [Novacetimonas pomaceti]PYD49190.1 hypothetical protein C3920_00735 [Novacetimonas pomaceti]
MSHTPMRHMTTRIACILMLVGVAACSGRHVAPPGGSSAPNGMGGVSGSPQQAGGGPGSVGGPGM